MTVEQLRKKYEEETGEEAATWVDAGESLCADALVFNDAYVQWLEEKVRLSDWGLTPPADFAK
jgi:hypothetical protein